MNDSSYSLKDELVSTHFEMYRDIHGFKPRHVRYDDLSVEELRQMIDELDQDMSSDWYKQQVADDEAEYDHYAKLDAYDDQKQGMEATPHDDDYFDTMDFGKERAKLRNFTPHMRENRKMKNDASAKAKKLIESIVREAFVDYSAVEDSDSDVHDEVAHKGALFIVNKLEEAGLPKPSDDFFYGLKDALKDYFRAEGV